MLSDDERGVLDALRTARDGAAALDGGGATVGVIECAMREVYAIAGKRDQDAAEQAEYLAAQVVLLTGAMDRAEDATATAKVLADGTTSVTVKVPPQEADVTDLAAVEPFPTEPSNP